ncbi:MAG: hypothetical protein RLY14_1296 [Planctomycetota bacterium]|jgi:hypothetical protein
MRRRMIASAVSGLLFWSCRVGAQTSTSLEQLKPYLQVKPISGEEKIVRVFISPSCQFSRMYGQFFKNLAGTLPQDKRLIYTPLVNRGDGLSYAMAFAAVHRFYPAYLDSFIEASMIASQDKGVSTATWQGLDRIGRAARLPESLPVLVKGNEAQVVRDVELYISLRHNLQVVNTPAVAVAGTYVVTPEFTKGDAALFSQLTNGIISMAR